MTWTYTKRLGTCTQGGSSGSRLPCTCRLSSSRDPNLRRHTASSPLPRREEREMAQYGGTSDTTVPQRQRQRRSSIFSRRLLNPEESAAHLDLGVELLRQDRAVRRRQRCAPRSRAAYSLRCLVRLLAPSEGPSGSPERRLRLWLCFSKRARDAPRPASSSSSATARLSYGAVPPTTQSSVRGTCP